MNVLLVTAAGYGLYKISVPDEIQTWCKKDTKLLLKYVETLFKLVCIFIVTKIGFLLFKL